MRESSVSMLRSPPGFILTTELKVKYKSYLECFEDMLRTIEDYPMVDVSSKRDGMNRADFESRVALRHLFENYSFNRIINFLKNSNIPVVDVALDDIFSYVLKERIKNYVWRILPLELIKIIATPSRLSEAPQFRKKFRSIIYKMNNDVYDREILVCVKSWQLNRLMV